ncbi:hypothetical protein P167DRAFT_546496 [Morchella conica CCBAS932]|uniref:RhoGAP-domain-containing protein n=1 Tax=Morchella conica CCBAS932 TaxID=1392247 RepID=A0A3N4KP93_9PEZI|nr:hypothetical protein P167DRAFT_546496 [Morchella conica CCBAS932]
MSHRPQTMPPASGRGGGGRGQELQQLEHQDRLRDLNATRQQQQHQQQQQYYYNPHPPHPPHPQFYYQQQHQHQQQHQPQALNSRVLNRSNYSREADADAEAAAALEQEEQGVEQARKELLAAANTTTSARLLPQQSPRFPPPSPARAREPQPQRHTQPLLQPPPLLHDYREGGAGRTTGTGEYYNNNNTSTLTANTNTGGGGGGGLITITTPARSTFNHRQPQPGTPTTTSVSVSQHQNQLERLAVEASHIAGVLSGTYPLKNSNNNNSPTAASTATEHYNPHHNHQHQPPSTPSTLTYPSVPKSLSNNINTNANTNTNTNNGSGKPQQQQQQHLSVPEVLLSTAATSPMPPSQFTNRPPPRTSSIDSAISTVSRHSADGNNTNGSSSSSGSSAPTPADIQTLIETAGSAEALIGYMLKEKASAATQNAQLWKLVDKQRAMILGLNKDLEQALKDKDRYRKKLKEQLGVVPPVPSSSAAIMAARATAAVESAEEHEDLPVESFSLVRSESMPLPERGRVFGGGLEISYPEAMETLEEGPSSPTAARNGAFTPESVRTPLGSQHSDSTSLKEGSGFAPLSPRLQEMYVPKDESGNADNAPFQYPVSSAKIASRAHHLMKLGISTNVAPVSGLGKSPIRKAPPAPLALTSPLSETRAQLHSEDEEEDDEYEDDNVSISEIPGYQQRAETEGEVIVTQEHNDESVSIERMPAYDRRTSWTHTPIDKKGPPSLALLPSVNIPHAAPTPRLQDRQAMSLAPPMVHNGKPFSPGLAADGSGIRQQFARAPLPSPGLPSSPRPIDRPMNSPKPKQRPQSPGSPRTSPLSPRLAVAPVPFQPSTPRGLMPQSLNAPLRSPLPRGHEKSDSTTSQGSLEDQVINLIIQPSAINSVDCRVVSSRMRPSRASMLPGSKPRVSENDSVFTLGVFARGTGGEILRVEKDVGALPALDAVLRRFITFNAKLPDRALFTGHAPARIDSRRAAVDEYFAGVLGATMDERAALALCQFFSTDVVDHIPSADVAGSFKDGSSIASGVQGKPHKEGYLTKRGKNFGGWKARYFVLNGPVLKYYEAPGGAHLGQIKLQSAQIGRQSQSQKVKEPLEGETDTESQYRHAFLILEPKRKDSSTLVRHVLCAESDAERDEWVEALMQYVDKSDVAEDASGKEGREKKKRYGPKHKDSKDSQTIEQDKLHALGYEQTTPGPEPARGPTPEELQRMRNTPSPQNSISSSIIATQSSSTITAPTLQPAPERTAQVKQISAPTNGSVISDLAAWGAKLTHSEQKAAKKRSIWGFRQRSSSDLDNHHLGGTPYHQIGERLNRSVFGATLEEAVHLSKPFGVTVSLPAVVYRCIEYLEAKDAASEEGIFRLSGSNVVIKGLRERFNTESDFNLLNNDEYYDVHAVAGLLKLYLRELPTNVLTTERREEFVKVTEMDDKATKIKALNELVHSLPIENFELLRALSGHLLRIVENSDVNKMTIRNVGIVFSPTLNIPAQVFSMFLHEYRHIFVRPEEQYPSEHEPPQSPSREAHDNRPTITGPMQQSAQPPQQQLQQQTQQQPQQQPSTQQQQQQQLIHHPGPVPGTPGLPLKTPLPNLVQEPQTPRTVAASYEPDYSQMFTPSQSEFPRSPLPVEVTQGESASGLSLPEKGGRQRRRESSMMFMMGGMRNKNSFVVPKAMVMEDSVYE